MDREKIISEFERWCDEMDDECPVICLDALALLKEQEPVEPEMYCVGLDKYKFYRCPVCKTAWYYKGNY